MEAPADSTWQGYSLAERDRRWSAVRQRAEEAGFDCLFLPLTADGRNLRPSSANARGNRADSRYLTEMESAALVLPTDGRPPIVINDRGRGNSWLAEARSANRRWGPVMAQALLDAGMERARIGVIGLRGGKVTHVRAFGGVVIHGAFQEVLDRLPNATFEDATDIVGFVRYVKSDEEIACLHRATAIADAAIDEMVEVARPGVDAAYLYAQVTRRLMELGSEHYHWALKIGPLGVEGARYTEPPVGERLERGTLITDEVSAIWGGMVAQEVQPILLGPIPDEWKPVIALQGEVSDEGIKLLKPGTTFGEVIDFVNGFGEQRGMQTSITMHGRGAGNDGPLLTGRARGEAIRNVVIEAGNAWVWKPTAFSADGRIEFQWGVDVVATEHGGEPLSTRPRGMISIVD